MCLPHWHSWTTCLRHIVESELTKFKALPPKPTKFRRYFVFNFLDVTLETRQSEKES